MNKYKYFVNCAITTGAYLITIQIDIRNKVHGIWFIKEIEDMICVLYCKCGFVSRR